MHMHTRARTPTEKLAYLWFNGVVRSRVFRSDVRDVVGRQANELIDRVNLLLHFSSAADDLLQPQHPQLVSQGVLRDPGSELQSIQPSQHDGMAAVTHGQAMQSLQIQKTAMHTQITIKR